jgi:hypothetical protein
MTHYAKELETLARSLKSHIQDVKNTFQKLGITRPMQFTADGMGGMGGGMQGGMQGGGMQGMQQQQQMGGGQQQHAGLAAQLNGANAGDQTGPGGFNRVFKERSLEEMLAATDPGDIKFIIL